MTQTTVTNKTGRTYIALDSQLVPIGRIEMDDLNQAYARACQCDERTSTVRKPYPAEDLSSVAVMIHPSITDTQDHQEIQDGLLIPIR